MWRRIGIVFGKEVLDNTRDRRSLLIALIYPLLGPLLLGSMIVLVSRVTANQGARQMTLPVQGAAHAPALVSWLKQQGIKLVEAPADPHAAVRDGDAATILVIPAEFSEAFNASRTARITVVVNSSRLTGLVALNRLAGILGDYNREVWGQRIAARGIDYSVLRPLEIDSVNTTGGAHISDIFLFMVPPLFIFNLFMGGVYLAIDTTSGERERGSLEPLLINPIERWELMSGKFLAALLFTLIAIVVQLLALKAAFHIAGGDGSTFTHSLSFATVFGIVILTLPLMMLAVGIQFIIATVTRSFKEAQTYLGLLPLVPALPGMLLVFAPVHTSDWMMAVPMFSQTLLLGQIVQGAPVSPGHLAISMISTLLLAIAATVLCARLYEREELIFGG